MTVQADEAKAELIKVTVHKTCRHCKAHYTWDDFWFQFNGNDYNNGQGMNSGLCQDCKRWIDLWFGDYKGENDFAVIDGEHYIIGNRVDGVTIDASDTVTKLHYKIKALKKGTGFGGDPFVIRKNNGEIIVTTDLWHQGTIPEAFKSYPLFKNNAVKMSV